MVAKPKAPKINDLIFKELIKRGYSLEGNTRIWNIADSKLWYLTPDQAQSYLDLEDEEKYKEEVTNKELKLIDENIDEILKEAGGFVDFFEDDPITPLKKNILATNSNIHDELRDLIKKKDIE